MHIGAEQQGPRLLAMVWTDSFNYSETLEADYKCLKNNNTSFPAFSLKEALNSEMAEETLEELEGAIVFWLTYCNTL